MSSDLADFVDGTPGRFVPSEMHGELVEAEHLSRYWWAAQLAAGRRVLDAGCGMAYGSAILSAAGAVQVTAVDVAEAVVESARANVPGGVTCEVGDVRNLPFEAGAFDLVVCFEVIEHIDDQPRAWDELRRVLAPDGLLVISSPNRDVNVPGNPHHVREYAPDEMEAELRARWPQIRLVRQHNFVATAVLEDRAAALDGGAALDATEVRKLAAKAPGEEVYTLALAGDRALPPTRGLLTLGAPLELRGWIERFAEQQRILEAQANHLAEVEHRLTDRADLIERLTEAETALSVAGEERRTALEETVELQARATRAERLLAELERSLSWRLTRPLRAAKRRFG
jgi:SAM-dependent methyltransferase